MPGSPASEKTVTALPTDGRSTTVRAQVAPPSRESVVVAGTRLGRYELKEEIGRGGMGVVFRGRDPALARPLAIKVLHAHKAGARAQVRFLDEARAMAKLRHPGVMPVFDVGRIGGHLYLVMPFVGGGTLHEWLVASPRRWCEVVARFVAAGRGLAAAHAAGVLHRDFKPHNVLLDRDGSVMVADFGIAAHFESEDAELGAPAKMSTVAGTPAYMAPEQARGEALDARADQYSFCISLWEGVYGERPNQASTQTSVGRFSTRERVAKPHHGTPQWLCDALLRGLAVNPAERWPSMTALLDHLEEHVAPAAPPEPMSRRHGIRAAAIVFLAMAVVVGVIVATRRDARVAGRGEAPRVSAPGIAIEAATTPTDAASAPVVVTRPNAAPFPAAPAGLAPARGKRRSAPSTRASASTTKPARIADDLSASRY